MRHENDAALEDGLVSRYDIRNAGNGEIMTEALHFIYLELGRLNVEKEDSGRCESPLERLAYCLKYMHLLEARPEGFDEDLHRMLFKASELAAMTQETRHEYDEAMTKNYDILVLQSYAKEEGLKKGAAMERKRIADALRQKGVSEEVIAAVCKTEERTGDHQFLY